MLLPFQKRKKEEPELKLDDLKLESPTPSISQQTTNFNPEPQQFQQDLSFQQPTFQQQYLYSYQQQQYSWDDYIQAIAERIVEEKLREINEKINQLFSEKSKLEGEIEMLKDRIEGLEMRIKDMHKMVMEKMNDYEKTSKEVLSELKAFHKFLQTMVPTIVDIVKQLKETVERLDEISKKLTP